MIPPSLPAFLPPSAFSLYQIPAISDCPKDRSTLISIACHFRHKWHAKVITPDYMLDDARCEDLYVAILIQCLLHACILVGGGCLE